MEFENKNIVFIVCDSLSAFHLPFHGYDRGTAPFLTELAENNIWFKYAYANAPWTMPSHASMLSGKLPKDHGCTWENTNFEGPSFVEDLRERGYETLCYSNNPAFFTGAGFGKGFDEFMQGPEIYSKYAGGPALQKVSKRDQNDEYSSAFGKYLDFVKEAALNLDFKSLNAGLKALYEKKFGDGIGENIIEDSGTHATNQLLKERLKEVDGSFFLFINYMENHRPYIPPEDLSKEFVEGYSEIKNELNPLLEESANGKDVNERQRNALIGLYDAATRYLDSELEDFYKYVQENFEDTVFIIVSDHGENLGDYGYWHHQYGVFEKLIRVPAIIAGDGVEGQVIEENVSLRQLKSLILGKKGIEDLGSEKIYAEYYSNPDNVPWDQDEANRSKCVIDGKEGLIEHTTLDDFGFEASNKGFSEESEDIESWKELSELLDRIFGTETEGLDI